MPKINILNQTFGRLTVIGEGEPYISPSGKSQAPRWICQCECGNTVEVISANLRRRHTQSCGCLRKERLGKVKATHGLSKHPLYNIWGCMNNRCNNSNNKDYKDYGAKGITVCPEWRIDNPDGCQNFIDDMYPSYLEACKTIDKPQLDKDKSATQGQPKVYSKDTCCWLSQADNKKMNNKLNPELVRYIRSEYAQGRTQVDIAKELGISGPHVSNIVNYKEWSHIA